MWWSISAEGLSVKYLSINRQGICGSSPCFDSNGDFGAGSVVSCCVAARAILTIHTFLLHRLVCANTRDGVVGCVVGCVAVQHIMFRL